MTASLGTARATGTATVAAAVVAGIQAVLILVVSKAALTEEDFAPVAQLWAIWAVTAASLNYGSQQWSAVRPAGSGLLVRKDGRPLLIALVTVGAVVGGVSLFLRERLFASDELIWPVFAALLPLGTALVGLNRGELARRGRARALAGLIAVENTIRLALTVLLAQIGAPAWAYGAALLAGFAVAFVPEPTFSRDPLPPLRPLAAAAGAGLAGHALLFGSPLLLAGSGGSTADVVLLFLVLSAVRAPFVLLQGLVPVLAVRFGADRSDPASMVRTLAGIGSILALAAFAVGALGGDLVVGRVFSIVGEVSWQVYGLVAATALVSVTLAIVTVRLVASSQIRPLVFAWIAPSTATAVALPTGLLDDLAITAQWILGCHVMVLAFVVMATRPAGSPVSDHSADSVSARPSPPTTEPR